MADPEIRSTPEKYPTVGALSRLTDTLRKMVSLDTPQNMTTGETVADIAAGFVPGVGTAQSARDFERARRESDKLGMGLAGVGMIPVVGGMVKPGKIAAKSLGELVDQYVRKVRKMDELGPATLSVHRVEAPASAEVPGWHISQDLPGILKTGAMTNKNIGNRNMQGWEPAHVGGAYFYSDPRLARAKWEDVAEVLGGDHALAAEMPVIRAQLRRGNRLVPDEDVGLSVPWQQSYKEGSFATTRPVLINQIDRIYSADPDITKDIIRDTVMRQRRYAQGGRVEEGMSQVSDDPIGDFLYDYEMEQLRNKIAENEAALIDLTPVPTRVETGSDPMLLDVYPRLQREMEANPDRYEYGTARLKDEEYKRPMLSEDASREAWLEYSLRPRGQTDYSDKYPPGMELPSGKRQSVNPRDPYYADGGLVEYDPDHIESLAQGFDAE